MGNRNGQGSLRTSYLVHSLQNAPFALNVAFWASTADHGHTNLATGLLRVGSSVFGIDMRFGMKQQNLAVP